MGIWLLIGIGCIAAGSYIRDKSIVVKENGKYCFKLVKTKYLKRGD